VERFRRVLLVCGCALGAFFGGNIPTKAQTARCVVLEAYLHNNRADGADVLSRLNDFVTDHPGTILKVYPLDGEEAAASADRLKRIAQHLKFDPAQTPVVYGCNQVIVGRHSAEQWTSRLESLLTMDVYVRTGCPHCQAAERYLERSIKTSYPALRVRYRNIITDSQARRDLDEVIRKHRQAATSVPVFHFCSQLLVGFDSEAMSGPRIEQALASWTVACRIPPRAEGDRSDSPSQPGGWEPLRRSGSGMLSSQALLISLTTSGSGEDAEDASADARQAAEQSPALPLPGDAEELPLPNPPLPVPGTADPPLDAMDVPLLGRVSVTQLGLPAFTIAVGLVDGFNPCAMWVLLFLLSILVNLKDRLRILAVAGLFVLISGLAYFAFMAAWLNVFLWVGLLRPVQVALAVTAIAVGAIHIKDFFAFKQGISLSIPDSAKPGIYARVRRIVTAENLLGALVGAGVLAVMVNIVELLCTAGLPALYTQILALQELPTWQNYAYLLLYNLAYMADDALMVAVVVVTLGRQKMQEKHGRVLKLISGLAILVLGVIMLVKPEWLV
jgi:glutaredoxin